MSSVLRKPVLVLNKNWQPVNVTDVATAVTKLFNDQARAICPDTFVLYTWEDWVRMAPEPGEPCVRAARIRIKLPEIMVATKYERSPVQAVTFSRRNVVKRDHYTCLYCGGQPGLDDLTMDHVVPKSKGGPTNWTNCATACKPCNSRKADRTPEQAGMRLKRQPERPHWKPYWESQGARVERWSKFIDPSAN